MSLFVRSCKQLIMNKSRIEKNLNFLSGKLSEALKKISCITTCKEKEKHVQTKFEITTIRLLIWFLQTNVYVTINVFCLFNVYHFELCNISHSLIFSSIWSTEENCMYLSLVPSPHYNEEVVNWSTRTKTSDSRWYCPHIGVHMYSVYIWT